MRSRWGSSCGGRMMRRAQLLDAVAVDGEPGAVVGDLEQDPAGLAEVDRVEVVAVDDPADVGTPASRRRPRPSAGARRRSWAPGDVMHRAGALASWLGRRGVIGDRAAAGLAAQLPRVLAQRHGPEQALEHQAAVLGVRAVGAHAVEALQGQLGRHLGVLGAQRGVARRSRTTSSWPRPSGSAKRRRSPDALVDDALGGKALGPEGQRVGGSHARDDPVHHPGAHAAGRGVGVLEERQLGPGPSPLVGVEQVVDARVVLVDRLGHQSQPEDRAYRSRRCAARRR